MPEFDVDALRSRFPALAVEQGGEPIALFDGPGGTQVPDTVIDAVSRYYRESNANHEGPFLTSQRSDAILEDAHAALADLLNAADASEIKFGANMTTLTMHVARSITASLAPGDEIVVTSLDHEANVGPWRSAAADRGITVRTVDIRPEDVTLDVEAFDAALHGRPKLVAFGWASNAVGSINPVAELVRRAHEAGALTYVDAVHAAPHLPIDVQAVDTDFLACSVYKFFGPHVGVLYGRRDILDALPTYKLLPAYDRFETGTLNHEGIAGSLAAVEYIAEVGRRYGASFASAFPGMTGRRLEAHAGMAAIRAYEMPLFGRLLDGLATVPGLRLWGIGEKARFDERTPTAAITLAGVSAEAVSVALGERGIATWWGNFYAVGPIGRLGLEPDGVLRIGLTHYNTAAEVDRLVGELREIASVSRAGADVAIIGGGIVGTALAADLAGRGARVTLFERAGIAAGASGRNSGAVWYPADPVLGALYRESLAIYRALVREIGEELADDAPEQAFRLDDKPAGILTLGQDGAALRAQALATQQANPDFRAEFVDERALATLEPGLAEGLSAVRLDIGFPVAPSAAAHAFAALAVARGADVRPGEDAVVELYGGIAAGVRTPRGVTPAGSVVVTAGPWSPALVDPTGAWRPILPFWGVIVELELGSPPRHVLEEADIDAAIEPDRGLADDAGGATGFSLVTAGGRSSLGSTFLPFEPDPREYEARLRERGARYLPAIAGSPTRGLRACARPLALDGRPLVGEVPGIDGLFIAAGHGPWGISTGPASARHVAEIVLGKPDPRTPVVAAATDPARFAAPPA